MPKLSTLLGTCILSLGFGTLAAQQPEFPVACSGQDPLPLVYGNHVTDCSIQPSTDVDRFSFQGTAGDRVRITVTANSATDPRLEVLDPQGAVLIDEWCNGACAYVVELELDPNPDIGTGEYLLIVSDVYADTPGSYLLQLERIPPTHPPVALQYDASVGDEIAPSTDLDFFAFEGVAGTQVRITVLATSATDPRLEVIAPSGAVIADQWCNGACSHFVDLDLPETGTYLALISDVYADTVGTYEINLSCIFGPCPIGSEFVRGDCNADDAFDIADPVALLDSIFGGSSLPGCQDACDANDDGVLDIADPIYMLSNLFGTGGPPEAPHPTCGVDPTSDSLPCPSGSFEVCP